MHSAERIALAGQLVLVTQTYFPAIDGIRGTDSTPCRAVSGSFGESAQEFRQRI